MSSFHRSGHHRISIKGNMHWVEDHEVTRSSYLEYGNLTSRKKKVDETIHFPVNPRKIESYTRPNAKCPVCKELVHFYQSPDGGRVFFDALGPPWPKHPCTDDLSKRIERCLSVNKRRYQWQENGWVPAREFKISQVSNAENIYEVTITRPDLRTWDGQCLFFRSNLELVEHPPSFAHYKHEDKSTWRISFWRKNDGASEFLAYEEMPIDWQLS